MFEYTRTLGVLTIKNNNPYTTYSWTLLLQFV